MVFCYAYLSMQCYIRYNFIKNSIKKTRIFKKSSKIKISPIYGSEMRPKGILEYF